MDGSEHAERALNVALELALQTEASITLLQVIEPTFILEPGILGWEHVSLERDDLALAAAEKNAAGYLSHLMERHAGRGVALSTAVRIGPIAATILQAAKEASTDVIVMATHGRTGLRRWVYGSVTEKVLRRASCGLLIVRIPAHLLREKAEQARSPEGLSFARSLPENEMESKK